MKKSKVMNAQASIKEHEKLLVLAVDGNIVSQLTTSVILQRLDYHVFSVKTAEEALTVISIASPHIVLAEIALPQMSGIDLLRRLKQEPRTREIPVIFYTKQQDPALRQTCSTEGCTAYLTYPADPDQLYEAIQQATETTPRHFVRLNTFLEIIVGKEGIPGHRVGKEHVSALSANGMFINMEKPLPFGTVLPFTLFIDDAPAGGIHIEGKVLYSHDERGGGTKQPGIGVTFTRLRPEDRALIQKFIAKKLTEGIAVII
jgi:CheY-like chemotaxis protein